MCYVLYNYRSLNNTFFIYIVEPRFILRQQQERHRRKWTTSQSRKGKCMYVDFLIVLSYTICEQWWCSCERNMLPFHIFVMMMRLMTYLKPASQCKFINGVLVYFLQCFRESSVVTISFIKWSNKGFKICFHASNANLSLTALNLLLLHTLHT